jgi:hypothetical protein
VGNTLRGGGSHDGRRNVARSKVTSTCVEVNLYHDRVVSTFSHAENALKLKCQMRPGEESNPRLKEDVAQP